MKLHDSRDDRDLDDAALLFNRLGYTTAQECIDLLTATYRTEQLLPRHRYLAEEVATRAHARRNAPTPDTERRRREPTTEGGFYPARDPWHPRTGSDEPGLGPGRGL